MDEYFTESEARKLEGQRLKTNREFSGIEKGTTGIVKKIDNYGDDWTIGLKWRTTNGNSIVDWFTKTEYEKYLEKI